MSSIRTPLTVSPHEYFGDITGRPLDYGTIYFGEPDKDPEFYPIDVYSDEALTQPIPQPIRTKGGFINVNGDIIEIYGRPAIYSVKVLDQYGRKIFYKGKAMRNNVNDDIIAEIDAAIQQSKDDGVEYAKKTVRDAINREAIEGGEQVDTFVVVTPKFEGAIARTQAEKNIQMIDVSDFVNFDDADHTPGLKNAVTAAKNLNVGLVCRDTRTLNISSDVDMSNVRYIDFRGDIFSKNESTVRIGGFSSNSYAGYFKFRSVYSNPSIVAGNPPSKPCLDVCGVIAGEVHLGHCNYLRLYADAGTAGKGINAYANYYLSGAVRKLEITDSGVAQSWNNENRFHGGRVLQLIIKGIGYSHNHNRFYNPTFEGVNVDIQFMNATDNAIVGARCEGVGTAKGVFFDSRTYNNRIIHTWSISFDPRGTTYNPLKVVDEGMGNYIKHELEAFQNKFQLIDVSPSNTILANASSSASDVNNSLPSSGAIGTITGGAKIKPSLNGFTGVAWKLLAITDDFVKVKKGDVIKFDCDYSGTVRVVIQPFDENGAALNIDNAIRILSSTKNSNGSVETAELSFSQLNSNPALIVDSKIKSVKVAFYSSSNQPYKSLKATLITNSSNHSNHTFAKPLVLNGKPTMGYARLGTQVLNTADNTITTAVFAHKTTATSLQNAGATSLTVDSASGVQNGDIYGVLLPSGNTDWGVVAGISGNSFTVSPLSEGVTAGAVVVFNRWV